MQKNERNIGDTLRQDMKCGVMFRLSLVFSALLVLIFVLIYVVGDGFLFVIVVVNAVVVRIVVQ